MRVTRSFAFVDLSGFTALTEAAGDEEAVAVLAAFRAMVREVCSRRGVRIAKWLGDGAMLVGVDTSPLLAATVEIQASAGTDTLPLAVRCGVTEGRVILLEGDDYVGHAVNVAARLCDVADGQEILALASLVGALPPWVAVVSGEQPVAIRGLERPLPVVRLGLRSAGEEAVADPVCGLLLTPATAVHTSTDDGAVRLFCSDSCLETWQGRAGHRGDHAVEGRRR